MARSVVCISRAFGAGGEEVGRAVAERLGYLYVDEAVIARAAERGGLDVERVADEERRKSLLAGLLEHLAEGGAAGLAAPMPVVPNDPGGETVRAFIREAVHEIAARGNAVIVAHAASFAVGPGPHAVRVLITAPPDARAKRLAAADGIGEQEAAKAIRRADGDRVDYLKRFYRIADELPAHYDLVVNTETISFDEAADLVVRAAAGRAEDEVGALGG